MQKETMLEIEQLLMDFNFLQSIVDSHKSKFSESFQTFDLTYHRHIYETVFNILLFDNAVPPNDEGVRESIVNVMNLLYEHWLRTSKEMNNWRESQRAEKVTDDK